MESVSKMTAGLLYWLLLKATLLSFSGFGSLPQVREDLVIRHAVVTDDQLNRAVLVARTTPGPMGVYVVSVGYEAIGVRGAIAGWLALATPALLIIPLLFVAGKFTSHPRAIGAINGLIMASATLLVWSSGSLIVEMIGTIRRLIA